MRSARPFTILLFVAATTHNERVGFDPRRQHQRTSFDYYFVAGSVIAVVALLAWALFA